MMSKSCFVIEKDQVIAAYSKASLFCGDAGLGGWTYPIRDASACADWNEKSLI